MATFASRLADWRWLFKEKGLEMVHSELVQFADGVGAGGLTLTGGTTFGAVDLQTNVSPAVTRTVQPSGQFNVGVGSTNPPTSKAPPGNFRT